jgi:hypothetical protein
VTEQFRDRLDYGNWVPKRIIYVPLAMGLALLASGLISSFLLIPAGFFILAAAYLSFVRFKLSAGSGNVQESIWELVIEHLDWNGEGKALDIGCGNGALAIKLASLPFDDGHFDAAVSNFVFHEVGGVNDKREVIREALRVLKKGGKFAFQDEFLIRKIYGDPDELVTTIKSWGTSKAELIQTRNSPFIPRLLKVPFILGTMGMIKGEK